MVSVDLNSDLGEGYGSYRCADDDAMLSIVTSANVACGFHAGDPEIMARTFKTAKERGVAVGAHPGFQDLWGFGRRRIPYSPGEIERLIAYQLGAAQALAAYAGHRISYIKVHGVLGNIAEVETDVAEAIVRATHAVDPTLIVLGNAGGEQLKASDRIGLASKSEIFADRAYTEEGRLVPRSQPGAMIHDPGEAAKRVLAMVQSGAVITATGRRLNTPIDSICVHGDSPHAVDTAKLVRKTLEAAGVRVEPFAKR